MRIFPVKKLWSCRWKSWQAGWKRRAPPHPPAGRLHAPPLLPRPLMWLSPHSAVRGCPWTRLAPGKAAKLLRPAQQTHMWGPRTLAPISIAAALHAPLCLPLHRSWPASPPETPPPTHSFPSNSEKVVSVTTLLEFLWCFCSSLALKPPETNWDVSVYTGSQEGSHHRWGLLLCLRLSLWFLTPEVCSLLLCWQRWCSLGCSATADVQPQPPHGSEGPIWFSRNIRSKKTHEL